MADLVTAMTFSIASALSMAALAAPAGAFAPYPVEINAAGQPYAVPSVRLAPGQAAVVVGRGTDRRFMVEEPDAIVHLPTRLRLPRVHQGCRLAMIIPLPTDVSPYEHGGVAAYDCSPSETLSHVDVSFTSGVKALSGPRRDLELTKVANAINQQITDTKQSLCVATAPSTAPQQAGLSLTQCSARRLDPRDPDRRTYGAATVVFGRGSSFVRFSRKCVDEQCPASLVAFAHFFDTLDLSSFATSPAM